MKKNTDCKKKNKGCVLLLFSINIHDKNARSSVSSRRIMPISDEEGPDLLGETGRSPIASDVMLCRASVLVVMYLCRARPEVDSRAPRARDAGRRAAGGYFQIRLFFLVIRKRKETRGRVR